MSVSKRTRRSSSTLNKTTLLSSNVTALAETPALLNNLQGATYDAVLEVAEPWFFQPGECLFEQGSLHNGIYIIQDGLIRSYYVSEDDREITLGFWAAGQYVGAPQIFGGGRHVWTSVAVEPSHCLSLPGTQLRALSQQWPDLALALIDALVDKAQSYCALLQLLATHSMRVRLAKLLVMLASANVTTSVPANLRISHSELANMIGSTRQWVSQTLLRFEREGLIEKKAQGVISILEPQRLAMLK